MNYMTNFNLTAYNTTNKQTKKKKQIIYETNF